MSPLLRSGAGPLPPALRVTIRPTLALLTLTLAPAVAGAQLTAEVSATLQPALSSAALWGGALTLGDVLGLRFGGAVAERPADAASGGTSIGAWAADADIVLAPGSSSAMQLYGFGGIGMMGRSIAGGTMERVSSWSGGGGVRLPLFDTFTIDASTRYRLPAGDTVGFAGPFPRGLEYRVALGMRFGTSAGAGSSPRAGSSRGGVFGRPATGGAGSARAAAVLPTAEQYLGVPYVWGGEDPRSGFDCSGFTQYVFRRHGVSLPRTSREQVYAGVGVSPSVQALRAGDLIMFAGNGTRIDHVAIYAGDGRIIHSTSSGGGVRYDDLYSQRGEYFRTHMVAARRVMDDGGSLVRALERSLGPISFDPPDLAPRP